MGGERKVDGNQKAPAVRTDWEKKHNDLRSDAARELLGKAGKVVPDGAYASATTDGGTDFFHVADDLSYTQTFHFFPDGRINVTKLCSSGMFRDESCRDLRGYVLHNDRAERDAVENTHAFIMEHSGRLARAFYEGLAPVPPAPQTDPADRAVALLLQSLGQCTASTCEKTASSEEGKTTVASLP